MNRIVTLFVAFTAIFLALSSVGARGGEQEPAPGKQVEQSLKVGGAEVGYQLFLPESYSWFLTHKRAQP